jgi:K+-sensing histidine kinase KdpD
VRVKTETLRNALLSAISHDLRTPLTRINGAALTLLEAGASLDQEEGQELATVIIEESQRMSDLTSKILNMARLTSGEIVLHQDWNAIEEIVGSALMRMDSNLKDRPVRTLISEQIPLVWLDAVLMEQVLVNVIENVVKYTPPGSPVDISAHVSGAFIELSVTDYGPGIPEGMEDKLFEKFFRLAAESCQSGVGLGLALSRTIIRAHGGDIKAINAAGKGLALIISLPWCLPPALDTLPFGGQDV